MTLPPNPQPLHRTNAWRWPVWGLAAALLSLPWLAMQFFPYAGVNWTAFDFAVFGSMLLFACSVYEFGTSRSGNTLYRAGFAVAILAGFFQVWINLAVGIVGNENEAINGMFFLVIMLGGVMAIAAKFRPAGMTRALVLTAIAQGFAGVAGTLISRAIEVPVLTVLFCGAWLVSALLFHLSEKRAALPGR